MIKQNNSPERNGQALILVIFLLLIVVIIAGGLASMWQSGLQTYGAEKNNLISFYLAQAGIEHAKIWATTLTNFTTDSGWFNMSTGRYNFSVQTLGGNNRRLRTTGQVLDNNNNTIAERNIQLDIDAGARTVTADSWREQ
jgi:type II secretory pathway component PulK